MQSIDKLAFTLNRGEDRMVAFDVLTPEGSPADLSGAAFRFTMYPDLAELPVVEASDVKSAGGTVYVFIGRGLRFERDAYRFELFMEKDYGAGELHTLLAAGRVCVRGGKYC